MTYKGALKSGFLALSAMACLMAVPGFSAFAETMTPAEKKCITREDINLTINFNNQMMEIKEAVTYIEDRIKEIEGIAKELGVEGLDLRSKTMNINANSNNNFSRMQAQGQQVSPTAVSLSGSISFTSTSNEKSGALIEALQSKGYNLNFRMSANRQCR